MSFSDFVEVSNLPIYRTHEKGDSTINPKVSLRKDYGFSCDVSNREWNDFNGQVEDAISFLNTYLPELKKLSAQYDIDDIRLDFPIESRLMKMDLFSQCDYLPPEIIKLSGEIGLGIEMSQYQPSAEE